MASVVASLLPLPSLERVARICIWVLALGRSWLSIGVSLTFMYTMFHVLAVVWAFLVNAGVTVALELSSLLLSGQNLLELDQPKAFATFYFFYATFRTVTKFGAVVAAVAWESFDDKQARKVVDILYDRGDYILPLLLLPQGLVALVVLVAPRVCMDETETADCSAEYDALEIICEYSPVSIFTDGHVLIRRITQHALVIGLIQVILVFATLFPKWQDRVLRCRGGLGVAAAVFLNSTLGVLSLLTFMYLVRWAALHLSVDILNVGLLKDEDALQDIGLGLTVLWNSWFFVLSCFLSKGSEHRARPEELSALFYIVKLCLIVMIAAYFWRGCGHPNIGFVAAQQELTGLMVLLPTFYALGYVFALFLDCITSRLVLGMILTTLVALYALESVGQVEWRNAPGLVLCAFIHIMTKLTGYFGTKELIFKRRSVSSLARAAVQADFATRNGHSSSSSQPIRIEKLRDDSRPGDANELPSALGKRSAASIEPRKVEISALESPLDVQDIRAARKLGVGLALCAAGIAFVLAIFILFTGSLAILQDEFKVFPETIRYSIAKDPSLGDEHLYIDHAKLAGLHLSKGPKGPDEVTRQSSQDRLGYASCGVHYFGLPLDAVDYAMLSEVAYFDRKEDIVDILQFAFAGSSSKQDFAVRFPEDQIFPLKPSKVPRLVEVDFPKLNVSVITVRGTDIGRMADFVEDIKMYTEPVVMQLISMVFPTVRFLSDHTIALMIDWHSCALRYFGLESKATYATYLEQYAKSVRDRRVVLTGHSLGGGIARLVALRDGYPSVTFSPPGIKQSHRKFGDLVLPELHDSTVTIIADHDIISRIDAQVGLLQIISCETSGQAMLLSCHMLESTICELINRCGDERFSRCDFRFSFASVVQYAWGRLRPKDKSFATSAAMVLLMVCGLLLAFGPRDVL